MMQNRVREMLKQQGISQIVLLGLCSGGEVAVGAAASDSKVNGVVLLYTPLLGRQTGTKDDIRQTANFAKSYWQKLFLPETWRKIFSFRVNYWVIFKVLFGHFQHKHIDKPVKEAGLLEDFKGYKGACLFVYAEKDPEAAPSENAYRKICARHEKTGFNTIPEANHNFYSVVWKQELIRQVSEWLNTNFSKEE
jgi:hypothetical protein